MNRRQRDGNTAREPSHVLAAVVDDVRQSRALTGAGIPATYAGAVLGEADPETLRGYFHEDSAQVYVTDRQRAEAVAERLTAAGIGVRIVPLDREDLS